MQMCGGDFFWEKVNQNQYIIESTDPRSTQLFAERLGEIVLPGDVICLDGDLGAGKTTFTQGFARGVRVDEKQYVSSPSFAIMHEYMGRIPLYHFDFYRLGSAEEIIDLGFEEFFYGKGVSVIEWPSKGRDYLPDSLLNIKFSIIDDQNRRLICTWTDNAWTEKIENINK